MLWAEYTSTHRAIRLHFCLELNRMIPAHFLVDTGKSNEKKALLEMLEVGVTYIADRGYLSFPLRAAIAAADAFFIIRAKANFTSGWRDCPSPCQTQYATSSSTSQTTVCG